MFRDGLKKVLLSHPDFSFKLFSYSKKKIWNQIKSQGKLTSKLRWSFLILIIKTAMNICKLSENSLKLEYFLTKNHTVFVVQKRGINYNSINNKFQKSNFLNPKKSNMYSGIRELSEFVINKTKKNQQTENVKSSLMPNSEDSKLYLNVPDSGSNRKMDLGNLTPQQTLKSKFTFDTSKKQ